MPQPGFPVRCNRRWHPGRSVRGQTRLFQPSGEARPGLIVSRDTAFGNRLLPTRDALKDGHPLLHALIGLNVDQISAWQPVLSNENGLFVPLDIREEFSRLTLQGSDEFGAHEVTLKYHFMPRKGSNATEGLAHDPTRA